MVRLTNRDIRLLRDVALSHVLSRDQILALGYFGSVTRANTRLRGLIELGLLRRLETPFFAQSLYAVSRLAAEVVGGRIAPLIESRAGSPRFLQHALMVTEARIMLLGRGASEWRFEPQLWTSFLVAGKEHQVRSDGLALLPGKGGLAVEVDLGHVNPEKFAAKLYALNQFVLSGEAGRAWQVATVRLLTLTTGKLRAKRLLSLTPSTCAFEHVCQTFTEVNLQPIGSWS